MALLVAISFGFDSTGSEGFTCSCTCDSAVDKTNAKEVLAFISENQNIDPDMLDEILVIENDEVIKHFDFSDWI